MDVLFVGRERRTYSTRGHMRRGVGVRSVLNVGRAGFFCGLECWWYSAAMSVEPKDQYTFNACGVELITR